LAAGTPILVADKADVESHCLVIDNLKAFVGLISHVPSAVSSFLNEQNNYTVVSTKPPTTVFGIRLTSDPMIFILEISNPSTATPLMSPI